MLVPCWFDVEVEAGFDDLFPVAGDVSAASDAAEVKHAADVDVAETAACACSLAAGDGLAAVVAAAMDK